MNAREAILDAVRAARPPAVARAEIRARDATSDPRALVDAFTAAAVAAGAEVVACAPGDVGRVAGGTIGDARTVLSLVPEIASTMARPADPHGLHALDVHVVPASLGVAENGAVWLATADAIERAALFLASRVVVVVAARDLVADLHDAYARLEVRSTPFGAFVAGPSKTADIEQALVVGAHGPKSLTVVLVRDDGDATS